MFLFYFSGRIWLAAAPGLPLLLSITLKVYAFLSLLGTNADTFKHKSTEKAVWVCSSVDMLLPCVRANAEAFKNKSKAKASCVALPLTCPISACAQMQRLSKIS